MATTMNKPIHSGTARTAPRMWPVYLSRAQSKVRLNHWKKRFFFLFGSCGLMIVAHSAGVNTSASIAEKPVDNAIVSANWR